MSNKFIRKLNLVRGNPLKRSMLLSTLCKPLGMIISLLYTPFLLRYLGDEYYGIWSTILSVINWINYFDVGIGQGLRNSLAKHIANKEEKDAKEVVSTGYVALALISVVTFIFGIVFFLLADIKVLFNTELDIRPALVVSFICICTNFVLGLSRPQFYATQQAEKVSFMTILTQGVNLIGILTLSFVSNGSLFSVAVLVGVSGILVNLCYSFSLWKKHDYLRPSFKKYNPQKLKDVCGVGVKFFLIQISALVLYSTDNMIITQLFGPTHVTPYHTSYTAFGIVNGLFAAFLSPLWSRYTVAMEKKDYRWIKKSVLDLDKFLPVIAVILLIGTVLFKPIAHIWLHKDLNYDFGLVPCMAIYFFLYMWGSIYATVLNGTGRINLQLILAVSTAIINIPLSIILGDNCGMGTTGVLLATIICMLITDIPVTIYTHKFLNKEIALIKC